ncbi:MAG: HD domain-containing protein [Lachnospiraceae bacterium]|jgi:HD-GYP domain-containing protein (c-di-GMP phosphodiesterase class II)|nr:HD domain-containing protein [Lachnospiraceae bacterium]
MKKHSKKTMSNSARYCLLISVGVTVNILLALLMKGVGLPLFLDTVGTIAVSAVGGWFPGILTAIATNLLCTSFDYNAVYFSFINALVAIFTYIYVRKYSFKNIIKTITFVVILAVFVGLLSSLIHWYVLGGAHNTIIDETAKSLQATTGWGPYASFCAVYMILNLIDKGFAVLVAAVIMAVVPQKVLSNIGQQSWMQKPLSHSEVMSIRKWSESVGMSMRTRIILTIVAISYVLIIVTECIAVNLYFEHERQEKTEIAWDAVKFAADVVDADKVEDYLKYGRNVPGYDDTEALLYKIRQNAKGVKYMYITQVRDDGCYFVFDLDSPDQEGYKPGEKAEFEEAFFPYVEDLLEGKQIEPVESDDLSGWVLTVYYPIKNKDGKCVCYAGADVSLDYLSSYMKRFLARSMLILTGFCILVIAFGLWITEMYTTYPLSSIAKCLDDFDETNDDQEYLEANVKKLRSLDIHTDDEVEQLYKSICQMTLNQSEQMRNIRRLSESTANMQDGLIITMADMVENRDSDTGAHIQKTAAYVKIIVEGLKNKGYYPEKITPKFMSDVVRSAPLHDVGKINIPDGILNKPGKLTDEEYEIMKTHTIAGKRIMENAISTVKGENYLKEARNMAAYHHERFDGKGYPEGLHGEVIPLSARIMAVADVFDALSSPRVYKPAFPLEKALGIIKEGSGTQFDPKCVEVFIEALPEVKVILKKYNEEL